ncbi:phytanoyl-CoA dioxygenase family protein [Halomonas profundus]|nr:phytanoyl-CoA dioxygenase family protein [Halomonas profundus]
MFADEKFSVFDEIVSILPDDYALTYSPLIRESFHFCLKEVNRKGAVAFKGGVTLSGVSSNNYPEKKDIKKIGYFFDEEFLKNVIKGFESKGVKVEKLELLPAQFKRVLSNKQKEEIDFFDSMLQEYFGTSIRSSLKDRFYLMNGMVADYYNLLKNSGVDALVFRVYYGLYYFPIILACKMLGITVIDIQHGINGFKHPCYSRFKKNEIGSPLLPDVFWTWSDMATKMLIKDSHIAAGASIIEGGNPIFSTHLHGKGKKILYTHQPQSKGIPVPIEEIKRIAQIKKREVVIRPHPLHVDEAKDVFNLLKKEGVKSKIEDPSKITINDSLSQSSVHITYSSTCALDALNFGIPSVYCHHYIGDVEKEFSTGLLFKLDEINKKDLFPSPSKRVDYSFGSAEKLGVGIESLLNQKKEFVSDHKVDVGKWGEVLKNKKIDMTDIVKINDETVDYVKSLSLLDIKERCDDITFDNLDDVEKVSACLDRTGIVIVPGFVSEEILSDIERVVNDLHERMQFFFSSGKNLEESEEMLIQKGVAKLSGYDQLSNYDKAVAQVRLGKVGQDRGMIDIFNVDLAYPSLNKLRNIYEGSNILRVVSGGDKRASCKNLNFYLNEGVVETRGFHADSYSPQLKAFIYLTDCSSLDDGPYAYVKGSHKDSKYRRFNMGISSVLPNRTEAPFVEKENIIPVMAKKGALVISDQSGFHRGFPQNKGHRRAVAVMNIR